MGALASVLAILLVIPLTILWFCLPFAVFGTKGRLDVIAAETRASREELRQVVAELQALRASVTQPRQAPAPAAPPMPPVPRMRPTA